MTWIGRHVDFFTTYDKIIKGPTAAAYYILILFIFFRAFLNIVNITCLFTFNSQTALSEILYQEGGRNIGESGGL